MHNEIVFKVKDAVKGRIHASFSLWCEKYTKLKNLFVFLLYLYLCEENGIDMGNLYIEISMTVSSNQKPQNNTKSITNL